VISQIQFTPSCLTLESVPGFIIGGVKKKESRNDSLRAGELARISGVSTDTLRHYERKGLLTSRRSPNGYRAYPHYAVDRVMLIRNALAIGFGLDELARILKIRDAGGAPCRQVRSMVMTKLRDLERLLCEMTVMRDELRRLLKDWDRQLESVDCDEPARLLESLATANFNPGQSRRLVKSSLPKRKTQKEWK
jgi:DNA-binding transcriptional MerR regulator